MYAIICDGFPFGLLFLLGDKWHKSTLKLKIYVYESSDIEFFSVRIQNDWNRFCPTLQKKKQEKIQKKAEQILLLPLRNVLGNGKVSYFMFNNSWSQETETSNFIGASCP